MASFNSLENVVFSEVFCVKGKALTWTDNTPAKDLRKTLTFVLESKHFLPYGLQAPEEGDYYVGAIFCEGDFSSFYSKSSVVSLVCPLTRHSLRVQNQGVLTYFLK